MAHLSENSKMLTIKYLVIEDLNILIEEANNFNEICLVILPSYKFNEYSHRLVGIDQLIENITSNLGEKATLITLGETIDLVRVNASIPPSMRYKMWIAIKRSSTKIIEDLNVLPQNHYGALIHTDYKSSLHHVKTRIKYNLCPACGKTSKDYGGKKHTYHEFGTLMSDVWRDIHCDLEGDITPIINRFADIFGIDPYQELRVLDCRNLILKRSPVQPSAPEILKSKEIHILPESLTNKLILGDCLEELKKIPDNSVDFAFADPPYNLGKKYLGYADDLEINEYFEWCDKWITELARVIRPGRTCAVLNIPLWAIRHFLHMEKILNFQNWIVWEALAYPVRFIMPAHYTILCFSKGSSPSLPGLIGESKYSQTLLNKYRPLEPLGEGFCLRYWCVKSREINKIDDRGPLTDIWWDIHRLKHNVRRVDHPCQVPSVFMYRLISIFTKPGEVVLDCFNGAGTTTLAAHQLSRKYLGIEISEKYHNISKERHEEIIMGIDPFRKVDRILTAKNSPVPRMPKRKYEVSKKTLQLEVKRIAENLGRLPSRDDVMVYGRYPIRYYDEYFASWGEVCAAARTTGMSENGVDITNKQPNLFEEHKIATT